MSRKFLIGIGFAFALIFAAGVAAVLGVNSLGTALVQPAATPAPAPAAPTPVVAAAPANLPQPIVTAPAELHSAPIGSSYVVSDSDLAPLADAVKLNDPSSGVGKEVWARETPIAEKLLGGMCDCDQRNWLKHYVATGQKAVAGSEDYPQSMRLLATLRRSNGDLKK